MKPTAGFLGALCAHAKSSQVPLGAALAGPAFPAPASLQTSSLLTSAVAAFEKSVAASAVVRANESAWAVAVFSIHDEEPLYEKYFTPAYNVSVAQVDRDSVFRIASVSKVFSVWSFLMEVGDEHFNDPITRYIPELAAVSSTSRGAVVYDDIDTVQWDEVTLGQLASHLAGIPRDCEYRASYDLCLESQHANILISCPD